MFEYQVVEKSKDDELVWRCEALQGVLKEVHSLFKMFHMSIHALIDKQPSGELARSHLHSFITDYLSGELLSFICIYVYILSMYI
jgi:hypothetical protein